MQRRVLQLGYCRDLQKKTDPALTALSSFEIGLSNFYRLSTGFAVLQTSLLNLYRASPGFSNDQNVLTEHLQAFNTLCGSQNV